MLYENIQHLFLLPTDNPLVLFPVVKPEIHITIPARNSIPTPLSAFDQA
jgi:hypothetical protein